MQKNKTDYANNSTVEIYKWIEKKAGSNNKLKTIIFPCSDLVAYTVDYYGNELTNCIIPGLKNQLGRVVELMDKMNQKGFAVRNHIPMAKTWRFKVNEPNDMEIPYPCILKPEVSAKGRKGDIRICENKHEFDEAVEMLSLYGYEEVVLQEFLLKQYEVCALGCIADVTPPKYVGGYIKKLLEWPVHGGSTSAGQFIRTPKLDEMVCNVIEVLYSQGYRGLYDIEFLVCDDDIYLNEMNFRHSGNGFGLIDNGVSAPYYYCKVCADLKIGEDDLLIPEDGKVIMEEVGDFKHRKAHNLSLLTWMKQLIHCSAYSVTNMNDIPGTAAFLGERIGNIIKKIKGASQ